MEERILDLTPSKLIAKQPARPKSYAKIDVETRRRLIQLIKVENLTLKQASEACGIKISTAKTIFDVYQKEGRVGKKNSKKKLYSSKQFNLTSLPSKHETVCVKQEFEAEPQPAQVYFLTVPQISWTPIIQFPGFVQQVMPYPQSALLFAGGTSYK
eukprot:TRINITY_DN12384_c0_g1_i1.p1 TRINITY_DN12384_c0_g1~~TRINITY_DN12384_c0_g1_i1.p1  ORF type:complete len:156 (-),score=13.51 TRINITY_DN12384_c0_g1_i1:131-598(-)